MSVISSGTPEGSRYLHLDADGQCARAHWRRATLVGSLAACFVLLVFGCKASLFQPGNHVRCRVARIEVSIVPLKRSSIANDDRCQSQPASGVEASEPSTPTATAKCPSPRIAFLLDTARLQCSPRSPPSTTQS